MHDQFAKFHGRINGNFDGILWLTLNLPVSSSLCTSSLSFRVCRNLVPRDSRVTLEQFILEDVRGGEMISVADPEC